MSERIGRIISACIVFPIIILTGAGCGHKRQTIYPWGWEKLGRPTDLLMPQLQEAFLGDTSLDSCERLVHEFHKYADSDKAPDIEKARATFWDARLAFASDEFEDAHKLFKKSLSMTDSLKYPFDAMYINLCLEPLEGKTLDGSTLDPNWYRSMANELEYALSNDARVFGAIRAQYLCCFMTYSGNPTRALHYALLADSLFTGVGRDADRLNNRMNVAANRVLTGDTIGALMDYEWIQSEIDKGVPHLPVLEPLVDYNRWIEGKDTVALMRMHHKVRDMAEMPGYNALSQAYLAEIDINNGLTDSLDIRIHDMEAGLPYIADASQRAVVIKILGRTYEALGNRDKALHYLNSYPEIAEEAIKILGNDNFSVAETERIINAIERDRLTETYHRKIMTIIIGITVITIAAILLIVMIRWVRRMRRARMESRKALEASRRSELSMALSVKEKERQIEQLRDKIATLLENEMIDTEVARDIESGIRSDIAASKANEEFARVFSCLSPEFSHRLHEACPRIGRNMLRMAQYIAVGMDNSHIARVMNIKPESVKQSRWRLRSMLGLESDANLDKVLRDML